MKKKVKQSYEDWLKAVRRESQHYRLLKKCNGQFNEEMLKHYYAMGLSPMSACNDMMTVT